MTTPKYCPGCDTWKDRSDFYFNPRASDLCHHRCAECSRQLAARRRAVAPPPTTKRCSTCGLVLPAAAFTRTHRTSTGLQSTCRACARASSRQSRRMSRQTDPTYRLSQAERARIRARWLKIARRTARDT